MDQLLNTIKSSNSSAREFFIDKTKITNENDIKLLYHYIDYNNKINESLYALFQLLVFNFKVFPNISNYLNLSFFTLLNQPFNFELYQNGKYKIEQFIKAYIYYCQTNFLISFESNVKLFSLIKELHFHVRKKNFPCDHKQGYYYISDYEKSVRKKIEDAHNRKIKAINPVNCPTRLLLLRDGRLLLSFERYQNIFVYSPNGNNGWNEYPEVIINNEENYFLIIELYNNVLLLIGKYLRVSLGYFSKKSFHIAFSQNDENDCCLYALQLKNKRILLLFYSHFILSEIFPKSPEGGFDYIHEIWRYTYYHFAYQLENELQIIKHR